jgi:hypothetical protein
MGERGRDLIGTGLSRAGGGELWVGDEKVTQFGRRSTDAIPPMLRQSVC